MHLKSPSPLGYSIRDSKGNISLKKFINTLDYSLDLLKLRESYEKAMRRKDFSYWIGKKEYTQNIINVKFTYAYKEFNKAGKNTYIKAGYSFRECEFDDCVCIVNGELIGIQTNVEVLNPIHVDILGDYFTYSNGVYVQSGTLPVIKDKMQLREYLYDTGFVCDGIEYVRYKRSSGSSRVGKCLFVNKKLHSRMSRWDKCGLNIRNGEKIDLAAYEAYISLPMSSIIDTVDILPENFLVIDDYESVFKDDVVAVDIKDGKLHSAEKTVEISNSIWDGESLMDVSLFGDYKDKGMLLLRNQFFKTCAFNTNIQQWFKDNNITNVSQLKGRTLAKSIEDIKIITTPSSIKYLKFGTLQQWFDNIDYTFGVVKHEKKTHFFDGRMVQCHYQLLNSLHLNFEDVKSLLQASLDYIDSINIDPDILRYHISYPYGEMKLTPLTSKNEIIFNLLGINNKFSKTKLYVDFKKDLIKAFIRNLKQGHILLHGNYSTLLGNGLEMLKAAIGKFEGTSELGIGNIHCKNFDYGKTILGSRSPHCTFGNILLSKNVRNDVIDRYFNLSNEIVCVNALNENIQQRLNGCDYDSDTIMLTDNELMIETAKRHYADFKVPTCLVSAKKSVRYFNNKHKTDLDVKTSVNKIGEIINLSQLLNSIFWDNINREKQTINKNLDLYNDICILSVLSGIEIDKAKKEFVVNTTNEIKRIKEKYKVIENGKTVKPLFFKMITTENGYEPSETISYRAFETPMDYLQKIITSYKYNSARKKSEPLLQFSSIITAPESSQNMQGRYYEQRDRIIDIIKDTRKQVKCLYLDYNKKSKEEKEIARNNAFEITQECVEYIERLTSSENTMYLLLKTLDNKKQRDIAGFTFKILFGTPNKQFFKMIKSSKEDMHELKECNNGSIKLYDFYFDKTKVLS